MHDGICKWIVGVIQRLKRSDPQNIEHQHSAHEDTACRALNIVIIALKKKTVTFKQTQPLQQGKTDNNRQKITMYF